MYGFIGLTPTLRRISGFVSPVWTLVCAQVEVAFCRSLALAGSLMGLRPVGRLNIREAVCPLLLRVLGASGIRWRSGCSVTLLVLGRTTGIVEPYACHAFLRRLCGRPVAVGFACGGMGRFVSRGRSRAGYRYVRLW